MKQAVIILDNGVATPYDLAPAEAPDRGVLWLDVEGSEGELEAFFHPVGIAPSLLRKALAQQHFPTASATRDSVMLSLPVRRLWDQKNAAFITFVMQEHRILTLHEEGDYDFERLRCQLVDGGAAAIQDARALLLYLFESLIETNIYCFMGARGHTESLTSRVDKAPRSVSEREVMNARRQVSNLLSQFEDQFFGLADLQALTSHPQLEDSFRQKIRDISEAQNHLSRNLLRLETILRDLEQHCQFVVQQQTDLRLRQLTVLSIIFMPLTLISGIYGMNFTYLPGTESKYGYYFMLGVMFLLAMSLLSYLRRKGWFN